MCKKQAIYRSLAAQGSLQTQLSIYGVSSCRTWLDALHRIWHRSAVGVVYKGIFAYSSPSKTTAATWKSYRRHAIPLPY
ncbi:hypothetical protein BOTBODRAFT_605921 [Botryobasidium botryosum FD-172 SS1]|uniref:Uncharacterized protein n=1 Tax=Botryobasidium botryosum (strain FD-172 SS1) TaxID=930990 RepID=A0A067N0W2_BOTB1|nr:hypothetical protein BOTBODRAFT_605921 [Botryobasidium botryosum FD-172 SS1]